MNKGACCLPHIIKDFKKIDNIYKNLMNYIRALICQLLIRLMMKGLIV